MKLILLFAVALLLQTNEVRSDMACFQGQKFMFASLPSLPSNAAAPTTCTDSDVCLVVGMSLTMSGNSGSVEVGLCVPSARCSSMTCDVFKTTIRQNMPGVVGRNMKISDCEVTCGQPASVETVPAQMPVLPINPESESETIRSGMACFQGQKFMFASLPSLPSNAATPTTCTDSNVCLVVGMSVTMSGNSGLVETGLCVPSARCSSMTCDVFKTTIRQNMPGVVGRNMKISDCEVTCGQPASVETVPAQMPVLPINPESESETNCGLPIRSMTLADNFNPPTTRRPRPRRNFVLTVRGTKKGYKPGNHYSIAIKSRNKKLRMTGFHITLHNTNSSSCSLGSFLGDRRRIAGAPQVEPGCTQPLVSQGSPPVKKIKGGKWIAPDGCGDLKEVELRAEVYATDNRLYRDFDLTPKEYRTLTRVIPLRPMKKKGGKKNKRRRQ